MNLFTVIADIECNFGSNNIDVADVDVTIMLWWWCDIGVNMFVDKDVVAVVVVVVVFVDDNNVE